jgi:hypothetical protein
MPRFVWAVLVTAVNASACDEHSNALPDRETNAMLGEQPIQAPSVHELLQKTPVVAVWLDSNGLHGDFPYLRVALWEDGHLLFAEDTERWTEKMRFGRIPDAAVADIKRQILDTGIFDLKANCYLVPDAPVICLTANIAGKQQQLYWDEVEAPNYGINTNPKPHHLTFKKTWKSANDLILAVIPDDSIAVALKFDSAPRSWYVKEAIQSE